IDTDWRSCFRLSSRAAGDGSGERQISPGSSPGRDDRLFHASRRIRLLRAATGRPAAHSDTSITGDRKHMTDVFIVSAVRTAIGAFGGALRDTPPSELGVATAKEAMARAGIPADAIGHAVYGQVLPSEPRDAYMARIVALESGLPIETPALTVNRLCGSGLQAIVSAAQALLLGDCDAALAGGAESMSRTPFHLPTHRWG